MDQITIAADLGGYATSERSSAIEGLLDGLNREVSVAAVDPRRESLNFRRGVDYILSPHWNSASIPRTHRHLVSEQHSLVLHNDL